jgi:hypothetical protein
MANKMEFTFQEIANIVDACFDHAEHRLAQRITHVVEAQVMAHLQSVGLLDANGNAKPMIFRPRAECYPPLVVQ